VDRNFYPALKGPVKFEKCMSESEVEELFGEGKSSSVYYDEKLYKVYEYFRRKGFYLSSGSKYGMHFLAYAAHPNFCHATYTIYVWRKATPPTETDLARMCRSAIAVHKIHLLAEVLDENNEIKFTRLEWFGRAKVRKYLV